VNRAELLRRIRTFKPEIQILDGGYRWSDWSKLDPLVDELFKNHPHQGLDAMLRIFERHPIEDNDWFWTMLHGIESLLGYERRLVASFRRAPSVFAGKMIMRIINSDQTHVGKTDLLQLLREAKAPTKVRGALREYAEAAAANLAKRSAEPRLKLADALERLRQADPAADSQAWLTCVQDFYRADPAPDLATVFAVYERFPHENYRTWNPLNDRIERTRGYAPRAIAAFTRKPTTGTAFLVARLAAAADKRAQAALRKPRKPAAVKRMLDDFL
jgi:hypothetical protein